MANKRQKNRQKQMQPMAFGSKESYCHVTNQVNDEATIYIYDVIGGWGIWAVDFIWMLSRITAKTIRVRVHCDGGWVTEAIAMHNALRKHPAHIIMEVDSIAASAASFLIQAGDERVIAENAQLMIHDVQGGVVGTEADIRAYADYIPTVREAIIATYDYRTNITADEAREMMMRGTDVYLNAEQALEMGFVDRIEKLADMSEPPEGFNAEHDEERSSLSNQSMNYTASLNELKTIYGLTNHKPGNSSVDSGQQDHGNKEEVMDQNQLIAELKKTGIDVSALQDSDMKLIALQGRHDALTSVIGNRTPEQLTAVIATADQFKKSLVNSIVANKRMLNLCGDSDEAIAAETEMLNCLSIAHLEGQATTFAAANKGKDVSQLIPGATQNQDDGNGSPTEVEAFANNIVAMGSRKRHGAPK